MISDVEREAAEKDTLNHIRQVGTFLAIISDELLKRAAIHDESKMEQPELDLFAEWGPKLKALEYGSEEYKAALKNMGEALQHHYRHNPHHPENHGLGINGMNLVDLIEMVCDWKASVMRVKDGDFLASLEINRKRFGMDIQLVSIIVNTIGLLDGESEDV